MKAILTFLALLALAFCTVELAPTALAAETGDTVAAAANSTVPWLDSIVTQYPWLATVLIVIGACRVVAKPLMSLAHTFAAYTPTTKDDAIVAKVEASWAWRAFCWLLDWTASVKIGTQRPTTQPADPITSNSASTGA